MDSVYLAVAGIALFVTGVVGFVLVALFFGAAALRYSVGPKLRPLAGRIAADARGWVAPAERPQVALVRVPSRSPSSRR